MTPKEKAEEITTKFLRLSPNTSLVFHKQCALIAVDFILPIAQATDKYTPRWLKQEYPDQLGWEEYYQQVKQEIEKL